MENLTQPSFSWKWGVALGTLLIIFGIVALLAPVTTTAGLAWLLGAILLASGVVQLVNAVRFIKQHGRIGRLLLATLSLIAGAVMLRRPVAGMVVITLILSFYLFVSAVGKGLFAMEIKPARGWGWIMTSAVVSFVLGLFLIVGFPMTSLVMPGVFFGVDLISFGLALYRVSFHTMKMEQLWKEEGRKAA